MNNEFTVGKDGITYRSKFEADFSNKFLYPYEIKYEYEKKYDDSNQKCDFYLTDYDIWIECVYHNIEVKPAYYDGRIIRLYAEYSHRFILKQNGARWNGEHWWIQYKGKPLNNLHRFMKQEDLDMTIFSNSKALTERYNDDLKKKILNKDISILIVNNSDIKDYNNLAHIIIAKGSKLLHSKILNSVFTRPSVNNSIVI